jgi:hypothetical protein
MRYATKTKVPIERSKAEIERTLMRYGASQFAYATKSDQAVVMFRAHERGVRFNLPLPDMAGFVKTKRGKRTQDAALTAWQQACRERWRALALVIKAKLEAVDSGITIFEEEFMAHLVTAGGRTLGERLLPGLDESLKKGASVPLLPEAVK